MTIARHFSLPFLLALTVTSPAAACPFCTAVAPTLTQQREAAAVVALGELIQSDTSARVYRLHKITQGAERLTDQESLTLPADPAAKQGGLALLLGEEADGDDPRAELNWTATPLAEAAVGYVFRSPSLRLPAEERLRYFAPFLQHADPLIAEDAYREFGHAPFDIVAKTADVLPLERMREWLVDLNMPQQRKGFYGMALGLAQDDAQRRENAEFLRGLIEQPASDLRAGFDGVLGGYLVAAGEPALALIEERYLKNPSAADGDVRHAMTALRFYHEFGQDIPRPRLAQAMRHLLARPEFAAGAIADLARWGDWPALDTVAGLFDRPDYADRGTRRAIAAFALVCPGEPAAACVAKWRASAPEVVSEAEAALGSVLPSTSS